jgi:hypothetical protein
MAYEDLRLKIGMLKAAADLSTKQYYFVKVTGADLVNVAAAGELAVGVQQGKAYSGEAVEVAIPGDVSKVKVGANAVLAGAVIASDANGLADTAAAGQYGLGIALTAGAAGEIIPVLLLSSGKV